jgi:hypothetical protein
MLRPKCLFANARPDSDPPWSVRNGVAAWTMVVPLESLVNVARVADVVPTPISLAAEYVYQALSESLRVTDQNHNSDQLKHARVRTNISFGMDFLQFSARVRIAGNEVRLRTALLRPRCYGETAFACRQALACLAEARAGSGERRLAGCSGPFSNLVHGERRCLSYSTRANTVRRSRPGANGGLAIVIRNVEPRISTSYFKAYPFISLGFL